MAKVLAINLSDKKGVIKTPVEKGYLEVNHGFLDDAHAGNWHRQISLLAKESINKLDMSKVGGFKAGRFAENITTQGIELSSLPLGTKLSVGEAQIEITQIGKECHNECEIKAIVGDCVMPREGVFAKVLSSGFVKPCDDILVIK